MKKIFGISTSVLPDSSGRGGSDVFGLYRDYVDAVFMAGGVPMLLPPVAGAEETKLQLQQVDVLIVSGGSDVNPLCYGEEPHPLLETVIFERDNYELALISLADQMGIPMLGICRGLQIINVAFGGTLHQDVSLAKSFIQHRQVVKQYDPSHSVEISSPSMLYEIFAKTEIYANSYHHQAIKQLASGFSATAKSKDGIIEGIERRGVVPILAVQWHPEMMVHKHPAMLELFRYFAR
jgi:putative glutamine amidotransferase